MPHHAYIQHQLHAIVHREDFPLASLAVAVIRQGQLHFSHAIDNRPLDARARGTISIDTLFRVASISKLMCAVGILRLVERGTLSLNADVSQWLGWRLRHPAYPDVPLTIAQMLSHTSSLVDEAGYSFPADMPLRTVLDSQPKVWGPRAPGTYFRYANLPWGVLATIMEKATGERFDRLMTRLVFAPLDIEGGFHPFDFPEQTLSRTTALYRKRDAQERWRVTGPWLAQVDDYATHRPAPRADDSYVIGSNGTLMSPQGGARVSVRSLVKIARLLLGEGEVDGIRLLRSETINAMFAKRWDSTRDAGDSDFDEGVGFISAWGLGVQHFSDTSSQKGDRLIEHGGFSGLGHLGFAYGLTAALVIDPLAKSGLIYCQGGMGNDPDRYKGQYSSNARYEERILTTLAQAL